MNSKTGRLIKNIVNRLIKKIPEHFVVDKEDYLLDIEGAKLAYYHRYHEASKMQVNMTAHSVVYVLKGAKVLHSKEGVLRLEKGGLAFLRKGLYLNTEKILSGDSFESITFFLQDDLLKKFVERNRNQLMHPNLKMESSSLYTINGSRKISSYFESLIPYFSDSVQNTALLKLKFEELLLNLIAHDISLTFRSFLCQMNVERKFSFKQFMEQNFDRNLSVNEMSFLIGMSLASFKRAFKESYSDSPGRWLKERRLEKGRELLEKTDKTIGEICDLCGFSSSSHFIHLFKHKHEFSPLKYRQNLRKTEV